MVEKCIWDKRRNCIKVTLPDMGDFSEVCRACIHSKWLVSPSALERKAE